MPDAEGHGTSDGLPDLPPEWGRVVIPDDPSALADEARQVRRELRQLRRRSTWRRRLGLAPRPGAGPPLGLPVLVLLVSMLVTLAGLAAVTWPPRPVRSGASPSVAPYPGTRVAAGPLPALDLMDAENNPVPLRGLLPAMIVLVDACACEEQVVAAAGIAPPGVTVVTVTQSRAAGSAPARGVRPLADPAGGLRDYLQLSPRPGTAPALLVDRDGTLARIVPELSEVDEYRGDLARLAP